MNTKSLWVLVVFTVMATLQSSVGAYGTPASKAHVSQQQHTTKSVAKFYGLGATGVVSVYDDSLKALLIDRNGKAMIWSPQGGLHLISTHLDDVQAISADGKHLIAPVIEHTNGPGSGEGRYYGHYSVWSESFGMRQVASGNVMSYQMGNSWNFSLSHDAQKILVSDGETSSSVYAYDSIAKGYRPLRLTEGIVAYLDHGKCLIPHLIIALSPDGSVILTDHGERYLITKHIVKLSNFTDSASGIYSGELLNIIRNNAANFAVSDGARSITAIVRDGPGRTTESYEEYERKISVRLLRWDQHDGYDSIATLDKSPRTESLRISEDGSAVAGLYNRGSGSQPFLWTEARGLQSLTDVFSEVGLAASTRGWRLQQVKWISSNGTSLAGDGIDPEGRHESWMAQLPIGWQAHAKPFPSEMINHIKAQIRFLSALPPHIQLNSVKSMLPAGTSYIAPQWFQGSRAWGNRVAFNGPLGGILTFYSDENPNNRVAQPYRPSSPLNYVDLDVDDFKGSKSRQNQFIHAVSSILGKPSEDIWFPVDGSADGHEGSWQVTWTLTGGRHISYNGDFNSLMLTFPYSITGNSIPGDM